MIPLVLRILFPVEMHRLQRMSLSMWLHTDAQRLARRIEPLFSHLMTVTAGGMVLMMLARIAIAWAQGRL